MLKDWEKIIESRKPDITFTDEKGKKRTKRGESTWKDELKKITDWYELLDLFSYLTGELEQDTPKFFNKANKTAGRRARNYAQKIKDTMGQIRVVILPTKQKTK
jgi:hypothetical protein